MRIAKDEHLLYPVNSGKKYHYQIIISIKNGIDNLYLSNKR